jgi:DNA-directed RNA polymerase specialized sigma24 family protein
MVQTIHPLQFSPSAQPDPGLSSEEMFLPLERKRIVSAAIQKLTPTLRTAMELREVGDLPIKETAGIMGLSVGTVKARIFRGRGKLRSMLYQYVGSSPECEKQASTQANGSPDRRRKQGLAQN